MPGLRHHSVDLAAGQFRRQADPEHARVQPLLRSEVQTGEAAQAVTGDSRESTDLRLISHQDVPAELGLPGRRFGTIMPAVGQPDWQRAHTDSLAHQPTPLQALADLRIAGGAG